METNIIRPEYFDGFFMKKEDFIAEQFYQMHMRRRINFMLFDGSGVVQVEPTDLRVITDPASPANKTFTVNAGMAISRRVDVMEGREVILRENSAVIDLAVDGVVVGDTAFVAGETAFVAIHYEEELKDPQTIADPNNTTRREEHARITVHKTWPPTAPPPAVPPPGPTTGESYILLGVIDFDMMTVDETNRQTAFIRASLFSSGPVGPAAPSITSMIPNSGSQSSTSGVQIIGTNLAGASVTSGDPAAVVSGEVATATTVDFMLTIGAASTFTITVDTGVAPPASATFTIGAAAPSITSMTPNSGSQSSTLGVQIIGTNLTGVSVTSDDSAAVVSGVVTTATTVDFTLTIGAASTFTITVVTGVAPPATATFTIVAGATTDIDFLSPSSQATGSDVEIRGTDIHSGLPVGTTPVVGTTIILTDGTNVILVLDTEVRPDVAGNQSVRFTVPAGHSSWSGIEEVTLQLTSDGGTDEKTFTYDD